MEKGPDWDKAAAHATPSPEEGKLPVRRGVLVVVLDRQGRIVRVNPACERTLGYSFQEVRGRHFWDIFLLPDQADTAHSAFETLCAGKLTNERISYCAAKDGRRHLISWSYTPLCNGATITELVVCAGLDITAREETEQALRDSTESFRGLFESSRDAIMTLEPPTWRFTSGNQAAVKMFGAKNEEEFISHEPWELSPELQPDGRASVEKAKEMIETATREGSCFFEWMHRRIGGEEFSADVLLTRMEQAGKVILQATVRDINERNRAEATIIRSKEEWERTVDAIPDLIALIDVDHRIVRANRAMAARLGSTPEQLVGQLCYEAVHGLSAPPDYCPHSKLLASGKEECAEVVEERLHGTFDVTATPLRGASGHLVGSVYVARDITERIRTEEALRRSEDRYRHIRDSNMIGIACWNPAGTIVDANDAYLKMVGCTRQDLQSGKMRWSDVIPAECARSDRKRIRQMSSGGVSTPFETEYIRRDGTRVSMLIGVAASQDTDEELGIAYIVDITERKQAEKDLREERRQIYHMERVQAMGEIASSLAHEVNQPLTGILSNAQAVQQFLAGSSGSDLGQLREILSDIVADGKRASGIVSRMRSMLRKEAPTFAPQDINEVVQEAMDLARTDLMLHGVSVRVELADRLPQVRADKTQVEQVILNLLLNAEQAMRGMAALAPEVVVSTMREAPDYVTISVRDTGPGIAAEAKDLIFEPFYSTRPGAWGWDFRSVAPS